MATMADSGLKPERIRFDIQYIQQNFRISLSKRTISMGRSYVGGGSSATTWVGGGATAMVNVGGFHHAIQGIQGVQAVPNPQPDDWQTMPVHAVITEEMIEHDMRNPFQRFIHRLGF